MNKLIIGELYYCALNLIEIYPNHHLSWYAIGVYYFMTKKFEVNYFLKDITKIFSKIKLN
jgi:anaphase-promoting complex subunit 6